MSFRIPNGPPVPRLPTLRRGPRLLAPVLFVIVALVALVVVFVGLYTELLWFRSVGYSEVFVTRVRTETLLFVAFGLITAAVVALNIGVAYHLRPATRPMSPEQQGLDRYRVALDPHRRLAMVVVGVLLGLLAGSSAAAHWQTWLLWVHATPFGQRDPQFHLDISYFAFIYPFQRFLLGFSFFLVVLSVLAAFAVHYLYGGVRLQTPGERFTPAARAHLSVLLGVFMLLKAIAYWLDRYGLDFSTRGFVNTGASYTDVNAVLPAKTILIFVALICAVLFFANVVSRGWLLPAVGFGLLVLCAVLIGGVYPAAVQQFQVKPSEANKERPYIQRNIIATRQAYDLVTGKNVVYLPYSGTPRSAVPTSAGSRATIANIRILDPNVLQPIFQQLQGFKNFYSFPDTLDVDRYHLAGGTQEEVVAVRDINLAGLTGTQRNWINERLVYTHGYGFVAAPSNTVDAEGKPRFNEQNIPPTGALGLTQPRVYFGENSPSYSIVGAPPGAPPQELDYPTSTGVGQQNTTYDGTGGVPIGSLFNRLLYAIKFQQKNILLSNGVNAYSRILYIRNPRQRVQQVAPYLTLDGNPYPAVVNGRIVWIVDGYTTSDAYPYSQRESLNAATTDTLTSTSSSVAAQSPTQINYIRNSVKAVVDAYNGTVTLYRWGAPDPVLQTWMKIFPGTIKPESSIPPALRAHFRYPEDLFKVQRELLTRYHISDPRAFYSGTDFWKVPDDPTKSGTPTPQPPYYLTLTLPGETTPRFRLTSDLLANARPNLAAFVSVNSDPSSPNYGRLTVLQLPSNTQADGPGQVANNFESYTPASTELSLLRRGGSDVVLGNLLTLPVNGGLLYVEPVYVQSTGVTSYPLLQRVLVSYNGQIAYKPTLAEALGAVFGTPTSPPSGQQQPPPSSFTGTLTAAVRQAIAQAQAAYAAGQAALRTGDFAAYGAAQTRLRAALQRLAQLAATPSASPAPTASPTP